MSALDPKPIAMILLAAGGSARMGSPKQLLQYKGKALLRHAVDNAVACGCSPIVVVIGHDAQRMREELAGLPVTIAENANWGEGMGTSLRVGVEAIERQSPMPSAVMTATCDQPLIDAAVLRRLIDAYRTCGYPMAAATYAGTMGVPAIFNRHYYAALRALPPEAGAKRVLGEHSDQVANVPMDEGELDIDTPEDVRRLNQL
jgi:molybdenum cofactor cytidylyltransferase